MECLCKNQMTRLAKVECSSDALDSLVVDDCYWCDKCGRIHIGGIWQTPESAPKPKTIPIIIQNWCNCTSWCKYASLMGHVTSDSATKFCPFCGKKLIKERLA